MTYGYSIRILDEVKNSDSKKLGVRLGLACISEGIPVKVIAKRFKVSRPTIYNWFTGTYNPNRHQTELIEEFLLELNQEN